MARLTAKQQYEKLKNDYGVGVASSRLTTKELGRFVQGIKQELQPILSEVRASALASKNIPTYAVDKFEELMEDIGRKPIISNKDRKQLESWYRQASYIYNLKSATLEGAQALSYKFEPFKKYLDKMTDEQVKEFWKAYSAYRSGVGATKEQFKYELFTKEFVKFVQPLLERGEKGTDIATMLEVARSTADVAYAATMADEFEFFDANNPMPTLEETFSNELRMLMKNRNKYYKRAHRMNSAEFERIMEEKKNRYKKKGNR